MNTEQRPSPPELKSIHRVATIPLIHDSLSIIDNTLRAWTPTAYGYGQAFGITAMNYSQPIQVRLAPLLVSADTYAMKGLDVAQERFPTPFVIKSEELTEKIKERRDTAYKSITTPVTDIAHNVDSSLTPIVDRLEVAIHKFNKKDASADESLPSSPETSHDTTQVRRVYKLGLELKDQIIILSSEQVKQLQIQYTIIQRAQDSAHDLNASLAVFMSSAREKSSEYMLEKRAIAQEAAKHLMTELEKYEAITKELPKSIQSSLKPVQEGIRASLSEISVVLHTEGPIGEKVGKVGKAVQENIKPLLHQATVTVQHYIEQGKAYMTRAKDQASEDVAETAPMANGDAAPESQ